jgi:hypothetical protein
MLFLFPLSTINSLQAILVTAVILSAAPIDLDIPGGAVSKFTFKS